MPSGDRRRSTTRNTAAVGTPIVRIQAPFMAHTVAEPSRTIAALGTNDTTNATSHSPTMISSRSVKPK